ncbi:MAG: CPBP family intramembrane metalloprotease [Blastocatellia bacterium]|nr:CPBP family intramembrane metalloprotease [Blastocatellia bacterium]
MIIKKQPFFLRKNIFSGIIKDFLIILILGTILSIFTLVILQDREQFTKFTVKTQFASLPSDDISLISWYNSQESVLLIRVSRVGYSLTIEYLSSKFFAKVLTPDWQSLGYGKVEKFEYIKSLKNGSWQSLITLSIIFSQIGFLIVGGGRAKKYALFKLNPLSLNGAKLIFRGLILGCGLIFLGVVYQQFLITISVNKSIEFWRLLNQNDLTIKCLVIFLVCIIAPISEEVFFRLRVLGTLVQQNQVTAGIYTSSVLFALLHLSFINFPIYFVFGILLAREYYQTQSILPCIIAHSLNNSVAIFLAL